MVSDSENNKPRDLFPKRVLKSYHKRQQIQQQRMTSTISSDEDGAAVVDGDFVPKKRLRVKKDHEPIDKSSCNSSTTTGIESSSKSSSSSTVCFSTYEVLLKNKELKYGFISMIGRRRVMEDAITVGVRMVNNEFVFFGAYDGHGGSRVAHACRDRLHYILEEELVQVKRKVNTDNYSGTSSSSSNGGDVDWEKVMVRCFLKMDDEVRRGYEERGFEEVGKTMGSSALVAIVGKEEVVVANCGDCRAILCSRTVDIPLSNDHKPDRPDEKKRVEAAGGKILNWNGSKVQGVLATSRSIGDYSLKPFVISKPEVTVYKRNEWNEFLIIATNGLWDVVSNEATCEVVRGCLDGHSQRRSPESDAAALLIELAIAKGSTDNISVIVVTLDKIIRH
ncbi:unnamed protein product [Withania somnifera]